MASYRKRSSGWQAEVRKRGYYRSATFNTKAEAKSWAAEIEHQINTGQIDKPSHGTVGDMFRRYAKEVSISKKSAPWEQKKLGVLEGDPLASVDLADLSKTDIADFRDRRLQKVSAATVNRDFNLLSSLFNHAIEEWGWIKENPCKGVKRPQNPAHRDRRISSDEKERICMALGYDEELPVTRKGQEVALAFLIALETAMRASEIVGLTSDRVNLNERYVTLVDTKNGDKRDVPLSTEAVRLLRRCPGKRQLFSVKAANLSALFRKARHKTGIEDLHFHDSRHEAITQLARKIDILDLARMVGHRDLKSLQIYFNATAAEIASRLD